MVAQSGYSDFFIQQEHLEHTYEQMLNYMLEGVQDPERDRVYHKLLTSILELADRVKDLLMENHSGWHTYILKREVDRQQELTGTSAERNGFTFVLPRREGAVWFYRLK